MNEQTQQPAAIHLTRIKTVGCYAHDEQGRDWATFYSVGGEQVCVMCGASISKGWWRAHSDEHVCNAHVELREP